MKYCIFSCTAKSDEQDTLLYKSCLELGDVDVFYKTNNNEGLSKSYNEFLYSKQAEDYDCVIFCHDDVFIDDGKLEKKLDEAFKSYDIVGLAGCLNPVIKKPALWHIMAGGFQGGNLRGIVGHYNSDGKTFYFTNFGPTPSRVAIIDGLFIAVNIKSVRMAQWKFNENFDFHHYDISSCIDANAKKLTIGVYPIYVIHNSPGLKSYDNNYYLDSENKFIELYSK